MRRSLNGFSNKILTHYTFRSSPLARSKKGIAKRGGDARAVKLEKWLQTTILGTFADRILPVERDVALEWGRICGEAESVGKRRPAIDSLIAATALVHKMKLVTRNINDMAGLGVPIFNPFDE